MKIRKCSSVISISVLSILAFFTIAPLYIMIATSLKDANTLVTNFWGIPATPCYENYIAAWDAIKHYIFNSFFVTICVCFGVLIVSILAGYAFAKLTLPKKELLFSIVLAFQIIPLGLILIPMFINVLKLGLNDTHLGVILPGITSGSIVATLLARTFFEEIPDSIFEASRIDGATELGIVLRIVIPISKPVIGTILLVNFFSSFNSFMLPYIILSSDNLRTIPIGLAYLSGQYGVNFGLQMAAYSLISIPLIILICSTMKVYVSGISVGAVKE